MQSTAPSQYACRTNLLKVRAGFVKQGLSLAEWCRANGVTRAWAYAVLTGARTGPAALELRDRLLKEAGVK